MRAVGNYRLIKPLGAGTAARVYVAQHQLTNDKFALKVLYKKQADTDLIARFVQEAKRLQALAHPNIVRVYEVGATATQLFYSMPLYDHVLARFINPGTWSNRRKRIELTVNEKLRILRDVARGIAYLHTRKIVHRDVCPQNILLDSKFNACISDLGMSKLDGVKDLPASSLGNPKVYGAPEQDHKLANAGEPADVWGFSMVAHHLLAGQLPKGRDIAYLHEDFPAVPEFVSEILNKALSKKPQDRPTSDQVCAVFENVFDSDGNVIHAIQSPLLSHGAENSYRRSRSDRGPLVRLLKPKFMAAELIRAHQLIRQTINDVEEAFAPYSMPRPGGKKKVMAHVDAVSEMAFRQSIGKEFSKKVVVYGEESIDSALDLSSEKRPCILADIIDGTDLLERNLDNWCSALVVFTTQPPRIEGAFVMQIEGSVTHLYYALNRTQGAFKVEIGKRGNQLEMGKPSALKLSAKAPNSLRDASVCCYGQKSRSFLNLLALAQKPNFMCWLQENVASDEENKTKAAPDLKFRFYNLAGNPMMVRLADGLVDVVFDVQGQKPHDVVPGAYIALKAGATMGDLAGKPVDETTLAEALLRPEAPGREMRYILARNEELRLELTRLL